MLKAREARTCRHSGVPNLDCRRGLQVCREWRNAADHNVRFISPQMLKHVRSLKDRFPRLTALNLTHTASIRNRDLAALAQVSRRLVRPFWIIPNAQKCYAFSFVSYFLGTPCCRQFSFFMAWVLLG